MTTTADYILSLAETVAQDFGNHGDATESYAALRTAVESLANERDALKDALQTAAGFFALVHDTASKGFIDECLLHCGHAEAKTRAALMGQP